MNVLNSSKYLGTGPVSAMGYGDEQTPQGSGSYGAYSTKEEDNFIC